MSCYWVVEDVKELLDRSKSLEAEDDFVRKGLVDPSAFSFY